LSTAGSRLSTSGDQPGVEDTVIPGRQAGAVTGAALLDLHDTTEPPHGFNRQSCDTMTQPPASTKATLSAIVTDATTQYFVSRHHRVAWFVDRHFSVGGSLRLHRAAIGWDVARAPFNLTMAAPQAALLLAAATARRLGAMRTERLLRDRTLLLRTAVGRELTWLVHTELLELPFQVGARVSSRDALAETILAAPAVLAALQAPVEAIREHGVDPAMRRRLEAALLRYTGSRAAAAEIATALLNLGTGAALVHQMTPGALTLGPALAASLAQHAAVSSFSLGTGLGSIWFSMFPVAPSAALVAGLTGGLLAGASVAAAFAGVVTDPVQRQLGLHQRRLHRMLTALERQMQDPQAPGFALHDHYVARLLDLVDLLGAVYRFAAP
jgi:hypothetical protein